jgi:hypothetical protein
MVVSASYPHDLLVWRVHWAGQPVLCHCRYHCRCHALHSDLPSHGLTQVWHPESHGTDVRRESRSWKLPWKSAVGSLRTKYPSSWAKAHMEISQTRRIVTGGVKAGWALT